MLNKIIYFSKKKKKRKTTCMHVKISLCLPLSYNEIPEFGSMRKGNLHRNSVTEERIPSWRIIMTKFMEVKKTQKMDQASSFCSKNACPEQTKNVNTIKGPYLTSHIACHNYLH